MMNIIKVKDFNIMCSHERAMLELYDSIFEEKIYDFNTTSPIPRIIDAGSNIGIATLFFKNKYPLANITCFEPDPYNFTMLQQNISINNLTNVTPVEAALSKHFGDILFYGEIGEGSDTRGNSISKLWGEQRITHRNVKVKTVKLSSYINDQIDLLKLDIEGAEQQVIEEIVNKLYLIKYLIIEVHEAEGVYFDNSLENICKILRDNNFELEIYPADDLQSNPKEVIANWVKKVKPKLSMIRAKKI